MAGPHRQFAVLTSNVPQRPRNDVATRYSELVWLFRQKRIDQGISHLEFDQLASFEDGYTSKLEIPGSDFGRSAVNPSFDKWLGAIRKIGFGLVLGVLDEKAERLKIDYENMRLMRKR